MKEQIQDLEIHLKAIQTKSNDLQNALDNSQQQEKRLQEQLNENRNSFDKWEEKYLRIYDKWQECEVRYQHLKIIEDKYQQIQLFLSNLGSFIGSYNKESYPAPQKTENFPEEQDLFGTPKPPQKLRN
jgi:chromosome segregation ATPase